MQERVITDQAVRRARRLLVDAAGWELNNSVHIPKVTCEKCRAYFFMPTTTFVTAAECTGMGPPIWWAP